MVTYAKRPAICTIRPKENGLKWFIAENLRSIMQQGAFVLPIFVSCIASLIILQKTRRASIHVGGSTTSQDNASIMVIIITFVYVIFNIPVFIVAIKVVQSIISHALAIGSKSKKEHRMSFMMPYDNYYSLLVVIVVCLALNSLINPIIYILRVKSFKGFVTKKIVSLTNLVHDVTQMSNRS